MKNARGWHNEPARHALAAKGVKTATPPTSRFISGHPFRQPEHVDRETADILKIERELGRDLKIWRVEFDALGDDLVDIPNTLTVLAASKTDATSKFEAYMKSHFPEEADQIRIADVYEEITPQQSVDIE